MRRHGVLRDGQRLGDIAGRHPLRLAFDQQPKDVEPGRLRERSKREDGLFRFHKSGFTDILLCCQRA